MRSLNPRRTPSAPGAAQQPGAGRWLWPSAVVIGIVSALACGAYALVVAYQPDRLLAQANDPLQPLQAWLPGQTLVVPESAGLWASTTNSARLVLVNAMPVGLSAVRMLRRHASVPLIAHFPFIAAFSRLAGYGIHSRVLTRLQRLAGFDAVIMPGFGPRMMTPEAEVLDCVRACLEPMGAIRPCLPVPGGSDSAATLEAVHRKVGSADFGFVPGRGVFGHPMGPAAGAASIRQAWDAIAGGIAVEDHAAAHAELRAALRAFGGRR